MGVEQQQGTYYQPSLFDDAEDVRHDGPGKGGTGARAIEERQAPTASDPARALTERLVQRHVKLQA